MVWLIVLHEYKLLGRKGSPSTKLEYTHWREHAKTSLFSQSNSHTVAGYSSFWFHALNRCPIEASDFHRVSVVQSFLPLSIANDMVASCSVKLFPTKKLASWPFRVNPTNHVSRPSSQYTIKSFSVFPCYSKNSLCWTFWIICEPQSEVLLTNRMNTPKKSSK